MLVLSAMIVTSADLTTHKPYPMSKKKQSGYFKHDCRVNQNVLINGPNGTTTWAKERVPAKYCVKMYGTSRK